MTTASDSAILSIPDELAIAGALDLIESAEVSDGVETNLKLLNQHFDIVADALSDLDREQT